MDFWTVFDNIAAFFVGYHVIIFLGLCAFIPMLRFRRHGLPAFIAASIIYLALPQVYILINGGYFWIADFWYITEWYVISYILYWLAAMIVFYACFQCSVREVLFYGTASYSAQWLSLNILVLIRYLFLDSKRIMVIEVIEKIVVLAVFYLVFVRRLRKTGLVNIQDKQLSAFLIVTLFSINIFTQSWQHSFGSRAEPDSIEIYGTVFSMLIALLLLIVQFGLFEQTRLRQEKELIEQMLRDARKQYELSKQNIDVINRKCHDMRHQINALRTVTDERQRQELFSEAENAIRIYSNIAKTGNEALDVVLTEKSLLCEEKEIELGYILNGPDFAFMETVDIYSLFGNALDNAIESVSKCPQTEKRIISVREQRKGDFINLTIENFCEDELTFAEGLPMTTKEDKAYHGFGTKSIRYIVEKYGGNVSMEQKADRFVVRAFFTVQDSI